MLNGHALQYTSDDLRSDREVVIAAVKQNGVALEYASRELLSDRDFMLAAVGQDGATLEYASDELRADREIVIAAVGHCGPALQFAANALRRDRGVVLAAMLQDESALQYADDSLPYDKRLLREVSERRATARYASVDTRFTLDPAWDAPTAARFVRERFAASGKLAYGGPLYDRELVVPPSLGTASRPSHWFQIQRAQQQRLPSAACGNRALTHTNRCLE